MLKNNKLIPFEEYTLNNLYFLKRKYKKEYDYEEGNIQNEEEKIKNEEKPKIIHKL